MPIRAVLYDFDGTLADSFAAITASTNHVRERYGLSAVPEEAVRQYVGLGLGNLMERMVPGVPTDEAVTAYREHHAEVMLTLTKLLPGVFDTLTALHARGVRQAVCSNKSVGFTKRLVQALKLGDLFDAVLGPEDVGVPKPDPAMLHEAVRRLGVSVDETVYVGDMWVDVATAKAAGMPVWIVPGGADGGQPAADAGPDRMLGAFAEVLGLVS